MGSAILSTMASPQTSAPLLTAEEFYNLPEPEQGGKLELIDGEVVYEMPANGQHGELAGLLIEELGPFVRKNKLGKVVPEVGFILARDPDRVLAPDVAFVSNDMLSPGGFSSQGFVPGPPTLAIEVVSPSNLDSEVALKVEMYLQSGVQRVWVVRPRTTTVTVHRPDHTSQTLLVGGTLASDDAGFTTPGFELKLATLFQDLQ